MTASSASPIHAPSAGGPSAGITRFSLVRIVLGTLAVVLPVALTMFLVHQLVDKSMRGLWPQLLAAALCVGGYWLYMRKVERHPMDVFAAGGAGRELAEGMLLGAVLFGTIIAVLTVAGVYQVDGRNGWGVLLVPLTELVMVALFEEILFRAVLFRNIERSLGSLAALAISAIVFGLAHLPNANVTAAGVGVTMAAGLMFAAAYLATRRLWLAVGMHFAWNFMLDAVFSFTAPGHPAKGILQGRMVGPDWLSGGAYGVEASLVTLVVLGIVTGGLLVLAQRRGHMMTKAAARAMA